jgi:hypothetical protein
MKLYGFALTPCGFHGEPTLVASQVGSIHPRVTIVFPTTTEATGEILFCIPIIVNI